MQSRVFCRINKPVYAIPHKAIQANPQEYGRSEMMTDYQKIASNFTVPRETIMTSDLPFCMNFKGAITINQSNRDVFRHLRK